MAITAEPRPRAHFADEDAPGWSEFLYPAFVIGCACATADVNATSKAMRRVCLAHGSSRFSSTPSSSRSRSTSARG